MEKNWQSGEGVLGRGGAKRKLRGLELKGCEKTLLPSVVGLSRVHGRWFDSDGQLSGFYYYYFYWLASSSRNDRP